MKPGSKKYRRKYDADMQSLVALLHGAQQRAFVEALAAGGADAVALFEQGRAALTKPRRVCVEMFLLDGRTFESIAEHTGYLIDDVLPHVVAGVTKLMPETGDSEPRCGVPSVGASEGPLLVLCADPNQTNACVEASGVGHRRTPPPHAAGDNSRGSSLPTADGVQPTPTDARPKKKSLPWWLLAAAVVVAGVYFYMNYEQAQTPVAAEQPVPVEPVPVVVVADTLVEAEPVQDSVPKSAGRASIVSISREEDGEYTSVPLIGRRSYDEYLSNAMMPLDEASRGEVTMTFMVNRYGHPSSIRANSALTHEANHEAIRLLTGGPEWAMTVRQVTLTIRFH
jgi:hypothetical protein